MPREDYVAVEACKEPKDVERLDPREYARLLSLPATQLDILRLRLAATRAIAQLAKETEKALRRIAER